jgi:class 3 adenylate cyclase
MKGRVVERRIVTVLFADLVGFTSLSERLDAEDVSLVQDAYFDAVRETIERHGGLLEKFVGDAAMAVFGAPRARDDDAERAVRAGLALVAAVERLGSLLGLDDGVLQLRVGINSGEVVYGEATAERGPVTGDTVNVAARLQAAAEPESVVVGELTALSVAAAAQLARLDALELKGKAEVVAAWRVVVLYPERSRERALGALRAPMLGRAAELGRLLDRLGEGSTRILVVAPPGVGKTRLLEEFGAEAERHGATVLRARLRPDLLSPFEPVGQLVRSASDGTDVARQLAAAGLSSGRAEVVRAALAAVIAPVEAGGATATDERERLFAAWLEGLDALAANTPTAWLVEDLHWASGDLLAFLDFASRAPSSYGRSIVATSRPSLLETAAEWCDRADVLDLQPLPRADTAALVRALLGNVLPPELVERIAERSGGNALFVEELFRMWASTGVLAMEASGAWALVIDAQDVALPPTVQAIYAGQLDDLPPSARTAARRASVVGRRFPFAALELLGVPDGEQAVATLARRGLLGGPHNDPVLGTSYVYRHALLRDAGYASLGRGERATLHLRLADWLAGRPDDALPTLAEVIARHYASAFESVPTLARDIDGRARHEVRALAADWFARASAVAVGFAAWESAVELAEQALRLTPAEAVQRPERLLALGQAHQGGGSWRAIIDLLAPEIETMPHGPVRGRAHLLLANAAETMEEHEAHLQRALEESANDPTVRARVLGNRAALLATTCVARISDAEGFALEALPLARLAGPEEERQTLYELSWARVLRGRPVDDLLERFHAASDAAFEIEKSVERVAAARLAWRGEVAEARAILSRLLALADERGEPESCFGVRLNLCELELRAGGLKAADRLLEEWEGSKEKDGPTTLGFESFRVRCKALYAALRGFPDEARRLVESEAQPYAWNALEVKRAAGIAALLALRPAEAVEWLRAVWEHTDREGVEDPGAFPVAPDLVEALVEVNELDEAHAVTERLRKLADEQDHPWGKVTAARCGGLVRLSASTTHDEQAAEALADAVNIYADLGLHFDSGRSLLALGRAQHRHRKWAAARNSLERAAAAFDGISSPGWAEEARAELGRISPRGSSRRAVS